MPTEPPPPPPWSVRASLVLWWQRCAPNSAVPATLAGRRVWPVTLWVLARYRDTPVGPYSELLVSPALLGRPPALHVPFIAVDSHRSVTAGRTHWALPKVLADFDWTPDLVRIRGRDPEPRWSLAVEARPTGPPVPMPGFARTVQLRVDGEPVRFGSRLWGWGRPARVLVTAPDPPAVPHLHPGTHRGFVLRSARLRVGPARPLGGLSQPVG